VNTDTISEALPLPVSLGITLLAAMAMLLAFRRVPDWTTRYLIAAVFVRNVMAAFPDYTVKPIAAGLTLNALGSLAIVGCAFLIIPPRRLLAKAMIPIYAMLIVVLVSSLASGRLIDGIDTLLKWLYFGALFSLVIISGERHGFSRLAALILPAFLVPIAFQMASVALGVVKAAENDGSMSYIGGYFHESGMATALLGLLFVTSLARITTPLVKPVLILLVSVGLVLANYRTALMAAAPMVVAALTAGAIRAFSPRQRMLVTVLVIPVSVLAFTSVASSLAERMADVSTLLSRWDLIFQAPATFTAEDRGLMSGRVYIWSTYIDTYLRGDQMQLLFGRGPDAYEDYFILYAHNTLIGYLFDFGILGILGLLGVWTYFLSRALRVRGEARVELLAGHAGFLILNMATMPHWLIEGNIFYAMVCGFTVLAYRRTMAAPHPQNFRPPAGVPLPRRPYAPSPTTARGWRGLGEQSGMR
jgi:hypothetical protein